jgi:hypothetical protein
MASRESAINRARRRATAISQRVSSREAKLNEIRAYYAKHGDLVLRVIIHAHNHDGDLRKLVHRVTGRVVTRETRQHEVLAEFLTRHGEDVFLRQAGVKRLSGSAAGDQEELDLEREIEEALATEDSPVDEAEVMEEQDEEEEEEEEQELPEEIVRGRRRLKLPGGEIIADRRSGKERRSGKDRRAQLETVFKNKRFGGDRRSGQERRLTPPEYLGD